MSPIVSEKYAFVIGVDTHAATHAFALVAGETGAVLDGSEFPTTTAGLARALSWLDQRLDGASALVVVEGTGSYGAIVTERLLASGHEVVEAPHMPAHGRQGKSDEIDAVRIARAVLGLTVTELRTPRALSTDRSRVAMRVLVVAREQMTGERTRAVNALNALVRTIDLGIDARRPLSARQLSTIARWRDREEDGTTAICRHEAVRLAQRVQTLDRDLAANRSDITKLVAVEAPRLLELTGVGAVGRVPRPQWRRWRAPAPSLRLRETPLGIGSTAAEPVS
jgi:transposase